MAIVNKLLKSDIINTIYKKTGRISYTTRVNTEGNLYLETITTKLGQDTLELNSKTLANGNQLRTLTEKIPGKNIVRRMQMLLNPDNDIVALKSNFKNIEMQEALSEKKFTNIIEILKNA